MATQGKQWRKGNSENDSALIMGKVPPQAVDLEQAVLGAILNERECLQDVLGIIVQPEMFYKTAHQEIYRAIMQLDDSRLDIDLLTVTEKIIKNGKIDEVGGPWYLTQLSADVVTSAHAVAHAMIVVEKFMAREAIRVSSELISDAYSGSEDVFDLIGGAETALNDLACRVVPSGVKSAKETAKEFHERNLYLQSKGGKLSGITSGLGDIDALTDGWQPGNLIVIGALPATGKSALSLNLAVKSALAGHPCAFFSCEMPTYELTRRCICAIGEIPMDELQRGIISDQVRYNEAMRKYSALNLFTDYVAGLSLQQLKVKARKLKRAHGIQLIIVDYIQIMTPEKDAGNREQQVSKLAMGLKHLAGDLGIAIIALSQVDKSLEKEARKPRLGDLRESAGIGQHADIVAMMYRSATDGSEITDNTCIETMLDFVKMRNGQPASVKLFLNGPYQQFNDSDYVFRVKQSTAPQQYDNPYAGINRNFNQKSDLPF